MTEDASPENLRKFLESDDPAMVMMGLSMAKNGMPDELLPEVLDLYMWNDDNTIRTAARAVFTKYASKELQSNIKKNWKPRYRTMKNITNLQEKVYSLWTSDNKLIHIEALIKILPGKYPKYREWAVAELGIIGDERAVEPLIENFELDVKTWPRDRFYKRAAEVIKNRKILQEKIAEALGKIGGKRAIEALGIISIHGRNTTIRNEAKKSLKKLNYQSENIEEKWNFSNLYTNYLPNYESRYFNKEGKQIDTKIVEMISEEKRWNIPYKE